MKIIAFGASYSKASINKELASHAASKFENAETEILDLNDFDLPLFTVDREKEGYPEAVQTFIDKLAEADLLIISIAEHNGSYSSAFKNLFDWASRIKLKMFEEKKMLLLSTATGPMGGKFALESAVVRFPKHGANILNSFTLPKFNDNFSKTEGITEPDFKKKFDDVIDEVKEKLSLTN